MPPTLRALWEVLRVIDDGADDLAATEIRVAVRADLFSMLASAFNMNTEPLLAFILNVWNPAATASLVRRAILSSL
jgi:hypothetical protein